MRNALNTIARRGKLATHGRPQRRIDQWDCLDTLGLPSLLTDRGYDRQELEASDAASPNAMHSSRKPARVLVTNRSAGGRTLSVVPPHHVVIARREQLMADLPAAFELLKRKYGRELPQLISFVTGSSRTGDIERILVLGARGPKKLTILCY